MRIAINSRSFLNPHPTGIGRYAANLVHSLLKIDNDSQYFLYVPIKPFERQKVVPQIKAKNLTLKRDYFKLGVKWTLPKVDIYHSPSPDVILPMNAKVIVTVHDFVYKAFPVGHTAKTLQLTDQQMKSFLPHVSKIICCSENTRKDLHRFFDVDRNKSCVVYQGVNKNVFYPLTVEQKKQAREDIKKLGINDEFILFVGTIEPRKNLNTLLKAFSELKKKKAFKGKLVVAGMKGWKIEGLDSLLKNYQIADDVIFLGFIADSDLRNLYNLCQVFVFPSFYEGFGYPILEAFSCGAASVVSNAASCPEIAQNAALLIEPANTSQIVEAIGKILDNPTLRLSLSQKALQRAQDFSFEKTARETLAVYDEVGRGVIPAKAGI